MLIHHSYADGQSEIVMGEAFKKFGWKRNDLVISTKVKAAGCGDDSELEKLTSSS